MGMKRRGFLQSLSGALVASAFQLGIIRETSIKSPEPDPRYSNADYEEVIIFHPAVLDRLVPKQPDS